MFSTKRIQINYYKLDVKTLEPKIIKEYMIS